MSKPSCLVTYTFPYTFTAISLVLISILSHLCYSRSRINQNIPLPLLPSRFTALFAIHSPVPADTLLLLSHQTPTTPHPRYPLLPLPLVSGSTAAGTRGQIAATPPQRLPLPHHPPLTLPPRARKLPLHRPIVLPSSHRCGTLAGRKQTKKILRYSDRRRLDRLLPLANNSAVINGYQTITL